MEINRTEESTMNIEKIERDARIAKAIAEMRAKIDADPKPGAYVNPAFAIRARRASR